MGVFRLNELKRRSRYAFNKNLAGKHLAEIPNDIVLFFETEQEEDPVGNSESITGKNHYDRGCVVLFGDLHLEFVKTEDFNDLRWQP
ncbi:MAG TPA: hypothetical protein ENH34_05055 [Phycisphaerales bacterium]|nr:hypothetical protein [Phycisphaerales bacterium]